MPTRTNFVGGDRGGALVRSRLTRCGGPYALWRTGHRDRGVDRRAAAGVLLVVDRLAPRRPRRSDLATAAQRDSRHCNVVATAWSRAHGRPPCAVPAIPNLTACPALFALTKSLFGNPEPAAAGPDDARRRCRFTRIQHRYPGKPPPCRIAAWTPPRSTRGFRTGSEINLERVLDCGKGRWLVARRTTSCFGSSRAPRGVFQSG
jgi:hypothetical protein